jgi:hypothetical protein
VVLFLLEDVFEEPSAGGVRGADPAEDFGIGPDDDALADEVLADHAPQISVFGSEAGVAHGTGDQTSALRDGTSGVPRDFTLRSGEAQG